MARKRVEPKPPPPAAVIVPEIRFVYRVDLPDGTRRFLRHGNAERAARAAGMTPETEPVAVNKLKRRSGRKWPWTQGRLPF